MTHGKYIVEAGAAANRKAKETLKPCPVFPLLHTTVTLNLKETSDLCVCSSHIVPRSVRMREIALNINMYVGSWCTSPNRRAGVVPASSRLLQRFGLDRSLSSPDLMSFSHSQYMTLDAVTLRDLEVCFYCIASVPMCRYPAGMEDRLSVRDFSREVGRLLSKQVSADLRSPLLNFEAHARRRQDLSACCTRRR